MPTVQTFGWCSTRDLTNQCGTPCHWVLVEHSMACCEFDREGFPHAQQCERFSQEANDGEL